MIELKTNGITYDAISGHPDVFICQIDDQIIVAPNLPSEYKSALSAAGIVFSEGKYPLGSKYPQTAKYNVVSIDDYLIHNFNYTDELILNFSKQKKQIQVEQAYTRCSLIALGQNRFITSDKGIEKQLKKYNLDVYYVNPEGIELPGFKNGFIGGCVGLQYDQLFLAGSLKHYPAGELLQKKLSDWNIKLIELYDGPLFDGGGILFL